MLSTAKFTYVDLPCHEDEAVDITHFLCILYKLGVIDEVKAIRSQWKPYGIDMLKIASDYLNGNPHVYKKKYGIKSDDRHVPKYDIGRKQRKRATY